MEAYPWGVCKYESEDDGDGFWEGVWWSCVAGVQDSPGLDVGDDSLDLVADLVDGLVIGLVVWVERQVRGFSFRGDHSQSDVPLVADVLRWWGSVRDVKQAAAAQSLSVVRASVLGVGDPGQGP